MTTKTVIDCKWEHCAHCVKLYMRSHVFPEMRSERTCRCRCLVTTECLHLQRTQTGYSLAVRNLAPFNVKNKYSQYQYFWQLRITNGHLIIQHNFRLPDDTSFTNYTSTFPSAQRRLG